MGIGLLLSGFGEQHDGKTHQSAITRTNTMEIKCPVEMEDCPNVQRAADLAVKKVFAILGVDIDKPDQIECFQQDLRFGRHMRRISDKVTVAVYVTVATIFVTAVATAVWAGIVVLLKRTS
ncbi:MAG: hypothetical protein V1784_03750 [bacterium]